MALPSRLTMPVYEDLDVELTALSVGSRIRRHRQRRGWTLKTCAAKLALSIGRLSAIETGAATLDVDLFRTIARTLGVPLEALLPPSQKGHYVVTRGSSLHTTPPWPVKLVDPARETLQDYHNSLWPLAHTFFGKHIEPFTMHVARVPDDERRFISHHDEEFLLVLRGTVECALRTPDGHRIERLRTGDAMHFRSCLPHCIRSTGTHPAHTVHVIHAAADTCDSELADHPAGRGIHLLDAACRHCRIADRLATLRRTHGLTVSQFAALVGVSGRVLRAIERGDHPLPLKVLFRACRVFRKPPEYFLATTFVDPPFGTVSRRAPSRGAARALPLPAWLRGTFDGAAGRPLASGFPGRGMDPWLVTLTSRRAPVTEPPVRRGQEFVYVLDGAIQLVIGGTEAEVLMPGDSCFIDAALPHRYATTSVQPFRRRTAVALVVAWQPEWDAEPLLARDRSNVPA